MAWHIIAWYEDDSQTEWFLFEGFEYGKQEFTRWCRKNHPDRLYAEDFARRVQHNPITNWLYKYKLPEKES